MLINSIKTWNIGRVLENLNFNLWEYGKKYFKSHDRFILILKLKTYLNVKRNTWPKISFGFLLTYLIFSEMCSIFFSH